MDGIYQNNIDDLPKLSEYRFENIFKVYNEDGYYFYNIINNILISDNIDSDFYYEWTCDRPLPWTTISYMHYDTIYLWWLICSVNNIQNPIEFLQTGTRIKILKPEYVRLVLDKIIQQVQK
jgi:hypothetical protein